jgi:O-antigen/teichoic acid export membrane protein
VYALGNALNRAGAFLLLPAYTKYLSVADYGALELFSTVATVVSGVLSMGLAHATLRFYFEYAAERARQAVVSTNLIASAAIGVVGIALISGFREPIMAHLFPGQHYPHGFSLVLITLLLELSSQIGLAYLRALEKSTFFAVLTVAKLAVQLAANLLLLAVYRAGVEGVLIGNLLAVAVGWLVVTAYTVRRCGLRFETDKLLPVLHYSFPFLLSTLVAIVSRSVDRLYVSGLLSLEALGLYSLALKFSRLTTDLIGEPFGRAYGAFRFTIMGEESASATQANVVRYLAAFLAVVGLGIVYFGRDVLILMADARFWPAADVLPLLVLAGVLEVLNYPLQTGILYSKATRHIAQLGLLQAVLATLGGFLMIKAFGLQGACAWAVVSMAISTVTTHRLSQRYFPVAYDYRRLGWLAGLTCVFYLAGLSTQLLPPGFGVVARLVLLSSFVPLLLASPVFERREVSAGLGLLSRRWTTLRIGRTA